MWLAIPSLLLNVVQFIIGISKDKRLKKYQDFENTGHLQVKDQLTILRETNGYALGYSGDIENCGPKLVQIQRVEIKWIGKDDDLGVSWHRIGGGFYLKPGESNRIQHTFVSDDIKKLFANLGQELKSSLLVEYIDASGEEKTKSISIAIIDLNGSILTRWHTDILS